MLRQHGACDIEDAEPEVTCEAQVRRCLNLRIGVVVYPLAQVRDRHVVIFFFFQAEDGIRDLTVWSSDVCSSDLRASGNARLTLRVIDAVYCGAPAGSSPAPLLFGDHPVSQ